MLIIALVFPIVLSLSGLRDVLPAGRQGRSDSDRRGDFEHVLDETLLDAARSGRKTACFIVELDALDELHAQQGTAAIDVITEQSLLRLESVLRGSDSVRRLADGRIGVSLAPVSRFDLDSAIDMARRLQAAMEAPIALDSTTVYVSASAGFCLSGTLESHTGAALFSAAMTAFEEARRHGPVALRAYSPDMTASPACPGVLSDAACGALENGQIGPWFQPQLSTDTGMVTGFEALARWTHPVRGMIPPDEFLPALEQGGAMGRLCEVMLYHALSALRTWDRNGLEIPHVGVNFAPEELRDPRLVEKVEWELDRFELDPCRLSIEVLETVIAASADDTLVRNITGLARLGCLIDLDDFGTGHASISSIRRLAVQRLKIDRSFVMKIDRDPEQQRMLSAILLMAEQLDLDTLAEGVETAGEHAMLAQLGCRHVQGFGIARPMPAEQTGDWVAAHQARLGAPPPIGRQTG